MEKINHECYVSLEVAKLLNKAGFDWSSFTYYDTNDVLCLSDVLITKESSDLTEYINCLVPTLEVAQRWLREVKGILLYITPKRVNMEWKWDFWYIDLRDKTNIEQRYSTKKFNTYEKAQEAGIKKALEIILEKGE